MLKQLKNAIQMPLGRKLRAAFREYVITRYAGLVFCNGWYCMSCFELLMLRYVQDIIFINHIPYFTILSFIYVWLLLF
jgi:hypothetical protein